MTRKRLCILTTLALLGVFGAMAAAFLALCAVVAPVNELYVYEPAPFPTTAEASKASPIPLPAEARNVRLAGYSQWIAHEQYLRFEAPVDVCIRHAAVVVPGQTLEPISAAQLSLDARPPDPRIFHDLSWFDLAAAGNVVGTGGGSQRPQVWIDQQRGVFYYRLTD